MMRTLTLLLLTLATAVHADTIISTNLLQTNPETITQFALQVKCTVTNISTKPVTVNSVRFLDEQAHEYKQGASNCTYPGTIFPGLACLHGVGKFRPGFWQLDPL
jgi:hypothetical protein